MHFDFPGLFRLFDLYTFAVLFDFSLLFGFSLHFCFSTLLCCAFRLFAGALISREFSTFSALVFFRAKMFIQCEFLLFGFLCIVWHSPLLRAHSLFANTANEEPLRRPWNPATLAVSTKTTPQHPKALNKQYSIYNP